MGLGRELGEITTCTRLLLGREGSSEMPSRWPERCEPESRLISMETTTRHPSGLVSALAPEQQVQLGMWPGHHLGSWETGGTPLMTFNNVSVRHLSRGTSRDQISEGSLQRRVHWTGVLSLLQQGIPLVSHHFIASHSFHYCRYFWDICRNC